MARYGQAIKELVVTRRLPPKIAALETAAREVGIAVHKQLRVTAGDRHGRMKPADYNRGTECESRMPVSRMPA